MEIILRMNVIEQTAFSLVDEEFRIFPVFLFCLSIRIERSIERFGFIGERKFGMEIIFLHCRRERDMNLISCNYS